MCVVNYYNMANQRLIDYIKNSISGNKGSAKREAFLLRDKDDKVVRVFSCDSLNENEFNEGERFYLNEESGPLKLDGTRKKKFFKVDSSFFSDLIDQKVCKSAYVSKMDNLLENGFVTQTIPVLVSEVSGDHFSMIAEELCCKLLNFYGAETVYNKAIYDEFWYNGDYKVKPFMASAHFLKSEEVFVSLFSYVENYCSKNLNLFDFEKISGLCEWLRCVFETHNLKVEGSKPSFLHSNKLTEEQEEFIEDFAYSNFIRKYPIGDSDLHSGNVGVVVNKKTKKIKPGPAFDFEYGFEILANEFFVQELLSAYRYGEDVGEVIEKYQKLEPDEKTRCLFSDLRYLNKTYPNALKKLVAKTDELLREDENGRSVLDVFLKESFEDPPILKHNEMFLEDDDIILPISDYEKQDICKEIKDNFLFLKILGENILQGEKHNFHLDFGASI